MKQIIATVGVTVSFEKGELRAVLSKNGHCTADTKLALGRGKESAYSMDEAAEWASEGVAAQLLYEMGCFAAHNN
ncbi:MAG: hypothetical protein OXC91_00735 [Rhodobacteraceae bacterium]|nr:hypothetical protein [Paracoccaceae bacterium]